MSKASLIVGNSNWAIKDSSLLGYNINDSNIYSPFPFDVTRASAATTVNKAGLIVTDTEIVSGELITNGDFSDGSNGWGLDGGWSVNDEVASCDGSQTGNSNLTRTSDSFTNGVLYKATYTISNYSSGSIRIKIGNTGFGQYNSANGTYTEYITAAITTFPRAQINADADFIGSIDNISVVEVNRNNLARIDYSDSTKGVLLTEPQSTNLITYSESFSSLNIINNAVVTSNAIISPSGLLDADEITFDGTQYGRVEASIAVTIGQPYTISLYLKNKDLSDVTQVWIGFSQGGQGQFVTITDEWQRYDITTNANGTSEYPRIQFSGAGSLYAWGFQTEQQPYATSIIPTSGSTVTRNQDLVTNESITSLSGSYTVFAHYDNYSNITGGSLRDWQSASNKVYLIYNYGGGLDVFNNSSFIVDRSTLVSATNFKIAIVNTPTTVKVFINGVDRTKAGATPNLTPITKWSNDGNLSQKAKSLKFYNTALSDSELITLTTI